MLVTSNSWAAIGPTANTIMTSLIATCMSATDTKKAASDKRCDPNVLRPVVLMEYGGEGGI